MSWKFTNYIRVELLKKILKQNNNFFIKYSHGDLLEYFEVDISKIYNFLTKSIPSFCSNIFIITFVIVFFGLKSIYIFLFFLVYLVLNFILVKMYRKNNKNKVIEESNYHEYMSGKYSEWLACLLYTSHTLAPFVQWLGHQIFTLETGVQFPYGVPLEYQIWSHSSVGRAPALQAGGHRFKSYCDHHRKWGCSSVG